MLYCYQLYIFDHFGIYTEVNSLVYTISKCICQSTLYIVHYNSEAKEEIRTGFMELNINSWFPSVSNCCWPIGKIEPLKNCCCSWAILLVLMRYWTVRINSTRQTKGGGELIHPEVIIAIVLITPSRWACSLESSDLKKLSTLVWRIALTPDCSCDSCGRHVEEVRGGLSQYTGQPLSLISACDGWPS